VREYRATMGKVAILLLLLAPYATRADAQPAPQSGGTLVTLNPSITTGAPDQLIGCMIYEGRMRPQLTTSGLLRPRKPSETSSRIAPPTIRVPTAAAAAAR
jgi:hypothetical protein